MSRELLVELSQVLGHYGGQSFEKGVGWHSCSVTGWLDCLLIIRLFATMDICYKG